MCNDKNCVFKTNSQEVMRITSGVTEEDKTFNDGRLDGLEKAFILCAEMVEVYKSFGDEKQERAAVTLAWMIRKKMSEFKKG